MSFYQSFFVISQELRVTMHAEELYAVVQTKGRDKEPVSQTDRAAEWVSFGQNMSGRQYTAPNVVSVVLPVLYFYMCIVITMCALMANK